MTAVIQYAYFFEISFKILNSKGYLGFIVPVSSISIDRMIPLQEMLMTKCSILRICNFEDRPGKTFQGLNDSRS